MAIIDYGAIVFKNGKLISTGMFDSMINMVGWTDTEKDCNTFTGKPIKLNGNCFTYIGDSDCTLGFYKDQLIIAEKVGDHKFIYTHKFFNCTGYTWSKWQSLYLAGDRAVVTKRNGYYVCKLKYKGDNYKVYFGHGVDFNSYKKWKIVNYYRSPMYFFKKVSYSIKRMLKIL